MTKELAHPYRTDRVIFQPTPYCNLRCKYCYLPDRGNKARMNPALPADGLKYIIGAGLASPKINVLWHAGEPLAVGLDFYKQAVQKIEETLDPAYEVSYSVQTNATLINQAWCEFFQEKKFQVGVSLDGPKFLHDDQRIYHSGKGSFDLVMRGVQLLKKYDLSIGAIAVVPSKSLDYADEIYSFFEEIGFTQLGINVEGDTGINRSKTIYEKDFEERYRIFFQRIYERAKTGNLIVREVRMNVTTVYQSEPWENEMVEPFRMVNVDYQGNFASYSPELLGMTHPKYGSFTLGNIYTTPFEEVLASDRFKQISGDIQAGVEECRNTCEYFFACKGGAPSNKLHENGSFHSTGTFYCKTRTIIPQQIMHADLVAAVK